MFQQRCLDNFHDLFSWHHWYHSKLFYLFAVVTLTGGIEIRDGRYGMYITDGKINVKMPNGITTDELTLKEAQKLIKDKKASPKKRFKKKK